MLRIHVYRFMSQGLCLNPLLESYLIYMTCRNLECYRFHWTMEAKRLSKPLKSKHLFSNIEVWRLVRSTPCVAWLWAPWKGVDFLWIEIASIAECSGVKRLRRRFDRGLITQSSHPLSSICFTFAFPNFGSLGVFSCIWQHTSILKSLESSFLKTILLAWLMGVSLSMAGWNAPSS